MAVNVVLFFLLRCGETVTCATEPEIEVPSLLTCREHRCFFCYYDVFYNELFFHKCLVSGISPFSGPKSMNMDNNIFLERGIARNQSQEVEKTGAE